MDRLTTGKILGAVLAGGLSTRFGSDKAQALLEGRRLIDHAIANLSLQCDAIIIVGREEFGQTAVPDWPGTHMGPLGGIAGALRYASHEGYDAVLTCGVDSPSLPADLLHRLAPAPACLSAQPVIGLWPTASLALLQEILTGSTNHSVRHFADRIGARRIDLAFMPANVNTKVDLEQIKAERPPQA